jgi:hypothetical protein
MFIPLWLVLIPLGVMFICSGAYLFMSGLWYRAATGDGGIALFSSFILLIVGMIALVFGGIAI